MALFYICGQLLLSLILIGFNPGLAGNRWNGQQAAKVASYFFCSNSEHPYRQIDQSAEGVRVMGELLRWPSVPVFPSQPRARGWPLLQT